MQTNRRLSRNQTKIRINCITAADDLYTVLRRRRATNLGAGTALIFIGSFMFLCHWHPQRQVSHAYNSWRSICMFFFIIQVNYLALHGGSNTKSCVGNIMEAILSNELSGQYSLTGQPPPIPNAPKKLPFRELQLYRVVLGMFKLTLTDLAQCTWWVIDHW
jgi:hypothetical protein